MKKILLLGMMMLNITLFAQRSQNVYQQADRFGPLRSAVLLKIQEEDTLKVIVFQFDNWQYQTIKDLKTIILLYDDKKTLLDDLKQSLLDSESKIQTITSRDNYNIITYNYGINVKISDQYGSYCLITRSNLRKLIEWVETI